MPQVPKATEDVTAKWQDNTRMMNWWLRNYQAGGGVSQEALERLLQRCSKRGIQVILIGVPVSSAHRRFYAPEVERSYRQHIDALVRTHGCAYHDYRDVVPDHGFKDQHHLNPEGARYFAARLAREVLAR